MSWWLVLVPAITVHSVVMPSGELYVVKAGARGVFAGKTV